MSSSVLHFVPDGQPAPILLQEWVDAMQLPVVRTDDAEALLGAALRARPRVIIVDARTDAEPSLALVRRLKADSYMGIAPTVVLTAPTEDAFAEAFAAGADEILRSDVPALEARVRLALLLRRSDRDTLVHPSTRLPGAIEIEAELTRLIGLGRHFAMCYADLDHFKEYNDRYSYYDGDRVIRILSKILHDVVKGICGERGFVGHIGGDDFIFIVPVADITETCGEIVEVFDALVPYQYSEQDRRAGYYFGKDRRGQLHKVPLMTVSIGVVTNERRALVTAAQVSELATEMKSYAKTLPGSVFTVDRRTDTPPLGSALDPSMPSPTGPEEET
jgi:diguanylate cyclase (GGDEF)-like protein